MVKIGKESNINHIIKNLNWEFTLLKLCLILYPLKAFMEVKLLKSSLSSFQIFALFISIVFAGNETRKRLVKIRVENIPRSMAKGSNGQKSASLEPPSVRTLKR